jgi:PhnB protein
MANEAKKTATANPIPAGYHTLTPYLSVKGGGRAIEFYKRAFGAEEVFRMDAPGGRIGHAELQIGDSRFMLADESDMPDAVLKGAQPGAMPSAGFHVYMPDVDAAFARAVEAGAKIKRALQDQFYGDRSGTIEDPFGHIWTLATHIEDVAPDEMKRRAAAMATKV